MKSEWKTREPVNETKEKRHYLLALAIGAFFVIACVGLIYKSGILTTSDESLLPQEINLSGHWKVNLTDNPKFADANFNDSEWCEIGVPNGDLIKKGEQAGACKDFWYDRDKFRNNTFWYRKSFDLTDINSIKEPSLFLGAVKERASIYLNGNLVGMTRVEDMPSIFSIDRNLLLKGKNIFSIQVYSGNARYPGLFHAFNRGVVLGEYSKNILPRKQLLKEQYLEPLITIVIQLFCLFASIFLLYYGFGASEKYRWLNIYFGSSALNAVAALIYTAPSSIAVRQLLEIEGLLGVLAGTAGFALHLFKAIGRTSFKLTNFLLFITFLATILNICAIFFSFPKTGIQITSNKIAALLMFGIIFYSAVTGFFRKQSDSRFSVSNFLIFSSMVALCFMWVLEAIIAPGSTVSHISITTSIVSVVIIFLSVRDYIFNEKALSFFGRFIRPGLKSLLIEMGNKFSENKKVFRGRKIPIVKIDISDHTLLTYKMPYGMKRLFQDLWFSVIDSEFSELTFVDKNVGDGSIYCVNETATEHTCTSTLEAVVKIRDYLLPEFWKMFQIQFEALAIREPQVLEPSKQFFLDYKTRTGLDFWKNDLKIHVALVFGFVDEGLWGSLTQSHYDVQGDLVTLASRIESVAQQNEILIDQLYLLELEKENFGFSSDSFDWRNVELKGIGSFKVGSLKLSHQKERPQIAALFKNKIFKSA
ncbi:MAG: hypothetical protein JWQ35_1094 [Bacteriovoracaceae bacterium]|nr:hypothetical protein [Bacteriovoracaceae bacterium]